MYITDDLKQYRIDSPVQNILVIGGAGAVGLSICQYANFLNNNSAIICIDPDPNNLWYTFGLGGGPKDICDIDNASLVSRNILSMKDEEILRLMHECDAVINCAAIVDISKSYDEIHTVNTALPMRLFKLANRAGVRNFVHISSASVYKKSDNVINEICPLEATSPYEQSKIDADVALLDYALFRGNETKLIILRPGLIYGPATRHLGASLAFLSQLDSDIYDLFHTYVNFTGGPKTNWVHVEDVAQACIAFDRLQGGIYNVCATNPTSFGDMMTYHLASERCPYLSRDRKHITIPLTSAKTNRLFKPIINKLPVMEIANYVCQRLWNKYQERSYIDPQLEVRIDNGFSEYLYSDMVFSNKKLVEELGEPLIFDTPDQFSVSDAIEWYLINGWLE